MAETDDIGVAIRDGLDLLEDGIETSNGKMLAVDFIDDEDPSNLRVVLEDGSIFRVSVVREG